MRKIITAAIAAIAAIGFAGGAMAEDITVTVPYADLDLATQAGSAKLDHRIEGALKSVCAQPFIRDVRGMQDYEACKTAARAKAMEQISLSNPFDGMELASIF
jgi:UrcA family protein